MPIKRYSTTFTGDGSSSTFQADTEEASGGSVKVGFSLSGTWRSCTAKLMLCADPGMSPRTYTAVSSMSYTADAAGTWEIPVGAVFRVTVTGSGSPIPSIALRMSGYIEAA